MEHLFHRFAAHFSRMLGSTWGFAIALLFILAFGFYTSFTERWTVESIIVFISFLMLFFIQHSQNVNDKATHLKLDEIVRALEGTRNEVTGVETKNEEEIEQIKQAHPDIRTDAPEQS